MSLRNTSSRWIGKYESPATYHIWFSSPWKWAAHLAGAPHERLEQILSSRKRIAPEGQLSNLYHDTLKQLFQDRKEQNILQQVFDDTAVLPESLPLPDFARLLQVSDNQVKEVQTRLTAIQTRGIFDECIVPPASERFHSSFVEFTMDGETDDQWLTSKKSI